MSTPSPFTVTKHGLSYRVELDVHYISDDEVETVRRYIATLKAENAKLRELVQKFAEYVSQDRCLGCVVKSRCCDGEVDECWLLTEIRNEAHELGIEVCDG